MGLCFAMFVFLTFRGPLASHDSNPYPNRSRIARYNASKVCEIYIRKLVLLHWESGKDPWVESACADCPGFLVPCAAGAATSSFVKEPQIVPLN